MKIVRIQGIILNKYTRRWTGKGKLKYMPELAKLKEMRDVYISKQNHWKSMYMKFTNENESTPSAFL